MACCLPDLACVIHSLKWDRSCCRCLEETDGKAFPNRSTAASITATPKGSGSGGFVPGRSVMYTELGSCSGVPDPAAELVCSCSSTLCWSVSSSQDPRRIESSWWHMLRSRDVVVLAKLSASVNSVTSSLSKAFRLPIERKTRKNKLLLTSESEQHNDSSSSSSSSSSICGTIK